MYSFIINLWNLAVNKHKAQRIYYLLYSIYKMLYYHCFFVENAV